MKNQQSPGALVGRVLACIKVMPQFVPQISPPSHTAAPQAQGGGKAKDGTFDFSFHDLLSIINPLQHLPVIGTLYRAITGDSIGRAEKIAGDTLYGGVWGAISSVADAAFETVTGKDFGNTVLAMFTGPHDKKVALADNSQSAPPAAQAVPDANLAALTASLSRKGIDPDIARRAVMAYQKSTALPGLVLATAQ